MSVPPLPQPPLYELMVRIPHIYKDPLSGLGVRERPLVVPYNAYLDKGERELVDIHSLVLMCEVAVDTYTIHC